MWSAWYFGDCDCITAYSEAIRLVEERAFQTMGRLRFRSASDGGPQEFVESIPFTETREYVQAILRNANVYQQSYGTP